MRTDVPTAAVFGVNVVLFGLTVKKNLVANENKQIYITIKIHTLKVYIYQLHEVRIGNIFCCGVTQKSLNYTYIYNGRNYELSRCKQRRRHWYRKGVPVID
jgi:hypothetical protein